MKESTTPADRSLDEIRRHIAIGVAQADRGEFVDGDAVFEELRQRSAELRRERERLPQSE